MAEYDNLHWDFREIDGYDKSFNFVLSEREAGKSTALWRKGKAIFSRNHTFLLTRQQKVSISEIYLNDCRGVINKFIPSEEDRLIFHYNKSEIERGIVDIYADTRKNPGPRIMFRCVALSNKLSDMKSLFLPNCECHFGDEFIRDVRSGEKYLDREAWKYKELINTFQREAPERKFKSYMFGNPYSRANPYFVDFGIDISKLKRGSIYCNKSALVQCYEIKPELRQKILEKNPLYEFDDAYKRYAFDGLAVNDQNMIIKDKQPRGFQLFCIVLIEGNKVGLYSSYSLNFDFLYWVGPAPENTRNRVAYALKFADLVEGAVLIDSWGRRLLLNFAAAMQARKVAFANSQYGYWAEEIYNYI